MATETVVDLSNEALRFNQKSCLHKLENSAEALVVSNSWPIQPSIAELSQNPYLKCHNSNTTAYVDVFVDNFLGLAQGSAHRQFHVQRTLFRSLEKVFQPLNTYGVSD